MSAENKNIRLLLIDDDEDDQLFFMDALREVNRDAICDCAIDGESGLKILITAATLPDYIFLDLNMPRMDGLQVLKQIKETRSIQHIPVIICSTSQRYHDAEQAKSLGALDYITKPTSIPDLAKIIRHYLNDTSKA